MEVKTLSFHFWASPASHHTFLRIHASIIHSTFFIYEKQRLQELAVSFNFGILEPSVHNQTIHLLEWNCKNSQSAFEVV